MIPVNAENIAVLVAYSLASSLSPAPIDRDARTPAATDTPILIALVKNMRALA